MSDAVSERRLGQIKHLVVLMMENRSFDQMLGYLTRAGIPEVRGLSGEEWNPDDRGNRLHVRPCDLSEPLEKRYDPCHGTGCVAQQLEGPNLGFVRNFLASRGAGGEVPNELRDLPMRYYTGELVPVYDALARAFCVCDAWHSSVPGDTWPNRLYAMAGRTGRRSPPPLLQRIRSWLPGPWRQKLDSVPIFDLEAFTRQLESDQWRWYSHDPATLRLCDELYRDFSSQKLSFRGLQRENFAYFDRRRVSFLTELLESKLVARDSFLDDVARGQLRDVSWIDPNFVDVSVLDPDSNDDHPPTPVIAGQGLVLEIYEALYKSDAWSDTLFVVVYDEHGGFYDHVVPPRVDDDPDFGSLGVRVPALVVGPRVANHVCHDLFDHTSLIKTILTRFVSSEGGRRAAALAVMPQRVQAAQHLGVVLGDEPRSDLPDPAELRPRVDKVLRLMRDSRRAALARASHAPDGVGQEQELHEFQQEFLRSAIKLREQGLPPGQP
jgi:phospholipase C